MSNVETASASEIQPGTLVMLGHLATHMERDLAWAFRSGHGILGRGRRNLHLRPTAEG
jgi:hypothetical protein